MRRRVVVLGMLALVGVFGSVSGGSAEVSGSSALYGNSGANVLSVSCAAAGDCVAGGYWSYSLGGYGYHRQAFVLSETNGVWGNPIEVPGTATLNRHGNASVNSVSCAAVGDCVAGGSYTGSDDNSHAFVVSETNGSWGDAIEVPGTGTIISAIVDSVSCGAVGDCAVGGLYLNGGGGVQAWVASETNGVWGAAIEVPGTAALNSGDADGTWVSCGAAGDCAAGGQYTDGSGHRQAFVASEQNGVWGTAIEVPGTAALNSGGDAGVESVSCAAAGDCVAGGSYTDGSGNGQAFVVSETNGVWGGAIEVPGTGTLNSGGDSSVSSVSCVAAGDCVAGGDYTDGSGDFQAFVVSEQNGVWGGAIEVPGTGALNKHGNARVSSISCAAAGDCAAGGQYTDGSAHLQAFVVSEQNGVWGGTIEVPGTAALNSGGDAGVESVSCAAAGDCVAGGSYRDGSDVFQAFVVNEISGSWSNAVALRHFPVSCVVPSVVGKTLRAAKRKLRASHCGVGRITTAYSAMKKGRVVAQRPKPGNDRRRGYKVALAISNHRRRPTLTSAN